MRDKELYARLDPVKDVARMLKEHLWGILNAIVLKVNKAKSELKRHW